MSDSRRASPRATRSRISARVTRGARTRTSGTSVWRVSSTASVGPGPGDVVTRSLASRRKVNATSMAEGRGTLARVAAEPQQNGPVTTLTCRLTPQRTAGLQGTLDPLGTGMAPARAAAHEPVAQPQGSPQGGFDEVWGGRH